MKPDLAALCRFPISGNTFDLLNSPVAKVILESKHYTLQSRRPIKIQPGFGGPVLGTFWSFELSAFQPSLSHT